MTGAAYNEPAARGSALLALLLAVFVVALGTGFILPILPSMIERLAGTFEPAIIARHTAFLTGVFSLAPLAVALPWGRLSDNYGRRPVVLFGLAGFAVTLAASALAPSLPLLYLARLLNGGFAAAIAPSALAFFADTVTDEHLRARAFGWISVAGSLGLLAGPMLGGLASGWTDVAFGSAQATSSESLAFFVLAAATVAAAVAVGGFVSGGKPPGRKNNAPSTGASPVVAGEVHLLVLAAVSAGALGTFEVGLTLRSREIAMTSTELGLMFAGCMLVMLVVQLTAFSPLVKPARTRWLIVPALVALGAGLLLIPGAAGPDGLLAATAIVGAAGGLLAPLLAYWTSRISGRGQGAEFGLQTAAVAFGLSLGSMWPGLLFGLTQTLGAAFVLAAVLLAVTAIASLRLPAKLGRLTPTGARVSLSAIEEKV